MNACQYILKSIVAEKNPRDSTTLPKGTILHTSDGPVYLIESAYRLKDGTTYATVQGGTHTFEVGIHDTIEVPK